MVSIEQVMEKASLFLMTAVLTTLMLVMVLVVMLIRDIIWLLRIRLLRHGRGRALNNLVQLTPIQPDTAALWTKINFNILTLCNLKRNIAYGTIHNSSLVVDQKKVNKRDCTSVKGR